MSEQLHERLNRFAGLAMQAMISTLDGSTEINYNVIADDAYKMAQAMEKARLRNERNYYKD